VTRDVATSRRAENRDTEQSLIQHDFSPRWLCFP
jgi:hypothetical protein